MSKAIAAKEVKQVLRVVREFLSMPFNRIWSSYDREADVLYINFKKPNHTDNSELTNDDIVVRYEKSKVIGVTVLHVCDRFNLYKISEEYFLPHIYAPDGIPD